VTAFVDECRREWRRLRVPAELADEMAYELEADLAEAGSLEELLGTAPVDASMFARNWATERGVAKATRGRRSFVPALLATLALAAAIAGAALTIHEANRDSSRLRESLAVIEAQPRVWIAPGQSAPMVAIATQAAADKARLAADKAQRDALLVQLNEVDDTKDHSNTLGLVLLIGGLASLVPLTLFGLGRTALDR
jgi:branched-subunit amino acid ABC-type transport system permease component